ncbi:MAG: hypothetical protein NC907_01150 [Candidatus Omnitrophica bacterium]|nr:hypothetical protein [Candidatus Omnitrophota bacterium]MCM8788377.1 hypothetical protein [Candidatus Omnitrophota bacterium]
MSEVILELVEEFFQQRRYFTARHENLILVRKLTRQEESSETGFILDESSVENLSAAVVKPLAWHTCKITTRVLETFPEILEFAHQERIKKFAEWFRDEQFCKLLIIPQFPAHFDLRQKVIKRLEDTGIDHIMTIPSIILGVINRIDPRKVYSSRICDLLRILKFYNIISSTSEQMELPL